MMRMQTVIAILKCLAPVFSLVIALAAAAPSRAAEGKIVLSGSSSVAPLAAEIAKRFEELNPGVRIDVQTGGSSRGISDVRSGLADIGMVSRDLKDEERDLKAFTVARDGIGVILNSANSVEVLSDQQIVAIYTGGIGDWGAIGGTPGPITVVNKAEGRSTLETFLQFFQLKSSGIRAHVIIGDNQQGIKTVAGNPNAIGYVSIGAAAFEAGQGTPIKMLGIGSVAATVENVRNGSYPLARPLNLVMSREPSELETSFLAFAQSPDVHDLIEEQFLVPPGP